MPRTLTAPAAAQAARKDGPQPVHILEIAFESGTVFWADEELTVPVVAEARVVTWGELQLDAVPGKTGGMGSITITVRDNDHFLKQEAAAQPGYQRVDATLYLWFAGTDWEDDRIVLFAGVLTAPCEWDESTACTRLTMKGREQQHDPDVGYMMTAQSFPEIDCKACENEIVPIVYGNPCRRVPACVVDRPGVAQLAVTLTSLPPSNTLTIDRGAQSAFFTEGVAIELIVGWPGRWERITGSFNSSSDTTFSITSRGSIIAEGNISDYAIGGTHYVTLPIADLPDTSPRGGFPLLLQQDTSDWIALTITHWFTSGSHVIVCVNSSDMDVSVGNAYQLLQSPGIIPIWPSGTQVSEAGIVGTSEGGSTWTYVANWLPSKSVDFVEIRARVNVAGGDSHVKWAIINPAYYSVDLDDRAYNTNIGREPGDPGLTTITLDFSPVQLGADDETIYVSLKGITDDNTTGGDVLEDPALVCENLLSNPFIGNIPADRIDSGSFAAAAALLTTRCGFALSDEKDSLNNVVADIANQAGCVFFWDGGKATIRRLKPDILLSDSQFTVNNSTRRAGSLKISEIDVKELTTEMIGTFRRTVPDNEQRIVRGSEAEREDTSINASSAGGNAGKTDFGLQRNEMDFWAFQFPSSVALATQEWCRRKLTTNRTVTVDVYLDAIKLQPGDVVTLDIEDGAGVAIFDSVPARIRNIRMRLGSAKSGEMPSISLTVEVQGYDYAVTVVVPDDESCAGQNVSGGRSRSRRLSVQAHGGKTGMHVIDSPGAGEGLGLSGGVAGDDPTANVNSGTVAMITGTYERPAGASSFS